MTWLWALLLRLFGRAGAKLPRGDRRDCVRVGALPALDWFAELLLDYRDRGGGEAFLDDAEEAWLARWLTWFERCAFHWAPNVAARRLGARPDGRLTLSALLHRLAIVAGVLAEPRDPPRLRRPALHRRLRRALRAPVIGHAPAPVRRALELSG
jgi:hypothetical protein